MGPDELLKRYQEAGADFVEMARTKAEELLRELGGLGGVAEERVGEARQAGRRGADQLLDVVRREVAAQLSALGLATRADLEAIEARLDRLESAGANGTRTRRSPAERAAGSGRAAPEGGETPAGRTAARKKAAPGNRPAPARKAAPAPKAAPARRSTPASRAAIATGDAARRAAGRSSGTERRPRS